MNSLPLVSIITPSYNQGRYIEETIISVLGQGYSNIEYFVIDGESTDETIKILKMYEDNKKLKWISEPDEGQAQAVNKGLRMCKGEIIGWLNSDDTYESGTIKKVVEQFQIRPEIDMIYGDANITDENNEFKRYHRVGNVNWNSLKRECRIVQPSVFFHSRLFLNELILDEKYHYAMDYDLWIRLIKSGARIYYLPQALSNWRIHKEAKSVKLRDRAFKEIEEITRYHFGRTHLRWRFLKSIDPVLRRLK